NQPSIFQKGPSINVVNGLLCELQVVQRGVLDGRAQYSRTTEKGVTYLVEIAGAACRLMCAELLEWLTESAVQEWFGGIHYGLKVVDRPRRNKHLRHVSGDVLIEFEEACGPRPGTDDQKANSACFGYVFEIAGYLSLCRKRQVLKVVEKNPTLK